MEAALPVFRDYSPDEHLLASSLLGPFTLMHTYNINKPRLDWLKRESTRNCKAQDLDHGLKKSPREDRNRYSVDRAVFFFLRWLHEGLGWILTLGLEKSSYFTVYYCIKSLHNSFDQLLYCS